VITLAVPLAAEQATGSWTPAATATLIAAVVAGLVAVVGIWINGLRADRARRRELYARGLAATLAYREFPYAIRRRRADAPGEERVRLSEALREVQQELAYCEAWMRTEPLGGVATEYRNLVEKTREVAGSYMHNAWKSDPLETDSGMNIPDLDYTPLGSYEEAYLDAVKDDLSWGGEIRWWRH
jgi:hypothetical protein